jgi:Zn-dependent metalloprotease
LEEKIMRANRLLFVLACLVMVSVTLLLAVVGGCSTGNPAPPANPLSQLEQDTGVTWVAYSDYAYGATSFLFPETTPPVSLTAGAQPVATAMAFFTRYASIFQIHDASGELRLESSGGHGGFQYAAFGQREGAASVFGTRLTMVFDSKGHIVFVSGLFVPNIHTLATTAKLSPADAAQKAEANMATLFPASVLKSLEPMPPPELTIYALGSSPVLAYSLTLSYASDNATDTVARQREVMDYIVDANSGAIILATTGFRSQHAGKLAGVKASGEGNIPTDAPKTFEVMGTLDDAGIGAAPYYMQNLQFADAGRGKAPKPDTFLGEAPRFASSPSISPVITSKNLHAWDTSKPDPGSAVDAYDYLGLVDKWWQAVPRNSYDDHGATIAILAHDKDSIVDKKKCVDNAFWDRQGTFHVCPHLEWAYTPSADLNILGHEFQHAVNQYTLDLEPDNGQTGAIDESLADIFGVIIANDVGPYSFPYDIGQNSHPPGLRDLQNPHSFGQPDNVNDSLYDKGADADPHTNDGVTNKAWYLMSFGGGDETSPRITLFPEPDKLTPIGWNGSQRLYLDLILDATVPHVSNFKNLARALLGLARSSDLWGTPSPEVNAVGCAWYAVGVLSKSEAQDQGVDLCNCHPADEASMCDGSMDASDSGEADHDDDDSGNGGGCVYTADGGQVIECLVTRFNGKSNTPDQAACDPTKTTYVPSCPTTSLVGCCTSPANTGVGTATIEVCAYNAMIDGQKACIPCGIQTVLPDGAVIFNNLPETIAACKAGGLEGATNPGTWSTIP